MLFDHIEEKEAVIRAALIEQNGYKFYKMLSEKTSNKEAKDLFRRFAHDEQRHLRTIENKYFPGVGFNDQITEEELQIEEYLERSGSTDIFTKRINVEALVRVIDNPKKALLIALDTERGSVEYFGNLARRARTEEGRKLYAELVEEEKDHVSALEAMLAAAS
ncbi:MAG TPA: ferritin family protein [Thermodesulfobacteriota bacterium]|nr:ferritin family protein [Thermodesulfobacteriota bacterium]